MIEVDGLTKKYGDKTAVDGLSFTVKPGIVTGFLGPNGAGKSTTMRMILGLDHPTSGTVAVNATDTTQFWFRGSQMFGAAVLSPVGSVVGQYPERESAAVQGRRECRTATAPPPLKYRFSLYRK